MLQPEVIPPYLADYIQACLVQACLGSKTSNWSFTQGLLLGQFSIIILFIVALRYLLLEDVDAKKRSTTTRSIPPTAKPTSATQTTLPTTSDILAKTFYDLVRHQPESVEWLNVLLAQAITQFREEANVNGRLMLTVDDVLNGGVRPDFVGPIRVTELNLGDDFPIFSKARIRPSDELAQMRAEIDFDFNNQVTLGIDTRVFVNWPKPRFAALPVSLVLSVIKFSGTLTVELLTTPTDRYIALSVLPDFSLEFAVQSLIGSRTKLEDVPKLADLITSKLRNVFIDRLVFPNFARVRVPSMWAGPVKIKPEEALREEMVERKGSAKEGIEEENGSGVKTKVKEKLEDFAEDVKEA
ncbi:hypothetical protein BC936DRAFT_146305 [Jimgerdemannia flammicorona]|uniref:Maintenance of mitochondrial morphology protein 1 n=1 Tax=Jimgerdemannia flammicorona TaxID=994334 RepID=A0A433DM03_9FUNG|nr:hypothetical protein BC936DRAFT_146305 [Jimgerdemannia flammicorona]